VGVKEGGLYVQKRAGGRYGHAPLISESETAKEFFRCGNTRQHYTDRPCRAGQGRESGQQHCRANSTTLKLRPHHSKNQPDVMCKNCRDLSNPGNCNGLLGNAANELQISWLIKKLFELPTNTGRKTSGLVLPVDIDACFLVRGAIGPDSRTRR